MMAEGSVLILGFAALTAIVPYLAIRRLRREYLVADASFWALLLALLFLAPRLEWVPSQSLAVGLFIIGRIALFLVFLAQGSSVDLFRWTATPAALFAGAVYLILVPHVLQWPVDGDEPYYVLITESILRDHDLDLANQYESPEDSVTRRGDLRPQPGDPIGPRGERYSRHEPFLSVLLVPGYLIGGLAGAVSTIAIFGALLVWSVMRLMEDEGIGRRAMAIAYPFIAFGPPVLFYSTRIWPEVPAAFFFSEALRATIHRRWVRMVLFLGFLSLLKLRFIPVAAALVLVVLFSLVETRKWWLVVLSLVVLAVPMALVWIVTGDPLNVHSLEELTPHPPGDYVQGSVGLLLDGQGGLLFQAPFWFAGLWVVVRWRDLPSSFHAGAIASLAYLLLLLPRAEWHGGWSPPLRYLVVFAPLFGLGGAWLLERSRPVVAVTLGLWTSALAIHGIAYPWRLFHIANGESVLGEWLSMVHRGDFSRLFPSVVRLNDAAFYWSIALAIGLALILLTRRWGIPASVIDLGIPAALTILIAVGAILGVTPARTVHFEDAHVTRIGGDLYPHQWTVARFLYSGGWKLLADDGVGFLYRGGASKLRYFSKTGATVMIDDAAIELPPTGATFAEIEILVPDFDGRHSMVCRDGALVLDWLKHE